MADAAVETTAWKARELAQLPTTRQVAAARFSPCGRWLATGDYDGLVRLWDFSPETPVLAAEWAGHHGWVQRVEWLPDGALVSADSWGGVCCRTVPAADEGPTATTTIRWQRADAHDGWIRTLAVDAAGERIATAGRDRAVRVWSAAAGELLREFPDFADELFAVAFHPSGATLVAGDLLGRLHTLDLASGERRGERTIERLHYHDRIQDVPGLLAVQFVDADTLLIAGARPTRITNHQGHPVVYRLAWPAGEPETIFLQENENDGFVFDLAWRPEGFLIAVTSGTPGSGQLLLHRPGEAAPLFVDKRMSNCHALAMHPDGRRLVVSATNRNSQGNGAVRDKDGVYVANTSPLHVFALEPA